MKHLYFFAFILISAQVFSQGHKFLNFPDFNDADLSKEKSTIDPKASAEFLYRSNHYWIDYETGILHHEVFNRVKIYDKEKAADFLNLEIPLYQGRANENEELITMKAFVYNLENGKKTETKVEKSSKFKSKENKYTNVTKFAFPNVNNGSVIEYKYEVVSPFIYQIPRVYIDVDAPSVYTEYVFDTPVNISYNLDYTGNLQPKHREVAEKNIYGANYRTYRFGFTDLKAFQKEDFVKNIDNYRTKIKAEVHSTMYNNDVKKYSASWEEIRKKIYNDTDFGGELKKSKLTRAMLPSNLESVSDPVTKADLIFKQVKNAFTWNEYHGFRTESGFKDLIATKSGNVADINLFLVSMMREAGLDAHPILISTVKNGMINLTIPNLTSCNYVIVGLKNGNELRLYDATAKQSEANLLPPRAWNSYGIFMTEKEAQILNINNVSLSSSHLSVKAKINEDGSVSGTYSDRDTGLYGMLAKENYEEGSDAYKNSYKDAFMVDFNNIKSSSFENGDFESTMNFSSNNMMDVIGKKIIINPMLFLGKTNNEFNQTEERKYQIDFLSPYKKVKKVELEIPEGYAVDTMPKNKKIVTEDEEISFIYQIENIGNKIVVTSTLQVASADYPKEYYPAFKQIWKTIVDSQNQVLSLVKK